MSFQLCELYCAFHLFGCSAMNPSQSEAISGGNTIPAQQLEKQIRDSKALRIDIDGALQASVRDIAQECGLFYCQQEETLSAKV